MADDKGTPPPAGPGPDAPLDADESRARVIDDYPPYEVTRRGFLVSTLGAGWMAFAASCGASLAAVGRFIIPNVTFDPPTRFNAGRPGDYEIGVDENWKAKFKTWIVRNEEGFYALSTICTHLGCTPNWFKEESKFKCPCHGSGFRMTGRNFEGPAPRPLERFHIELGADGNLYVDKSRKYRAEMGQWTSPGAFLKYSV